MTISLADAQQRARSFVERFLPGDCRSPHDLFSFISDTTGAGGQPFVPTSEQLVACLNDFEELFLLVQREHVGMFVDMVLMDASSLMLGYLRRSSEAGVAVPTESKLARSIRDALHEWPRELFGDSRATLEGIADVLEGKSWDLRLPPTGVADTNI